MPGELVERPVGRGTEEDVARSGGSGFGDFCRNKSHPGCGAEQPAIMLLSRAQSARTIQGLDSGFRRNDEQAAFGNDNRIVRRVTAKTA